MSEEIRSTIALIAGATVLILGYVRLFLKRPTFKQKFINKQKEKGNFVNATLVSNDRRWGNVESGSSYFGNPRMYCEYKYTVNGVAYKKKLVFQSPGMVSIKFPTTVVVYYDPNKPSKGVCAEETTPYSSGCVTFILLAAIATFVTNKLLSGI